VVERGPTSRLEIFRIHGAASSSRQAENTWGVRTLDFIPRNAFVCEVTGQYVLGRTQDGTAGSATDAILRASAAGSSSALPCAGQAVTPVRAWGAQAVHDTGFSPLSWAANEIRLDDTAVSGSGVTVPIARTEGSVSSTGHGGGGAPSRALTEQELLRSEEHLEQVRTFLRGEVCVSRTIPPSSRSASLIQRVLFPLDYCQIDSRVFGNVGSFIRRRPHRTGAATAPANGSEVAPTAGARAGDMLLRRLVYTNKRDSKTGLKMALFAACNIPANTELLI
jgi:hypothetical protein